MIDKIVSNAGKKTKNVIEKSKEMMSKTIDVNDDGKVDFDDLGIISSLVGDKIKKGTQTIKEVFDEKQREFELKMLRPIFIETICEEKFVMSKFIRVTDRDKKYIDSELCAGSIGYESNQKGLHIINLFRDSISSFGLTFYPNSDSEFYYVDPSDKSEYIALDDYFSYLKLVRISELQKIAQDLGAKHFKVTYKEEKSSIIEKNTRAKADVSSVASGFSDSQHNSKTYSVVEIAAEMSFSGHSPMHPTIKYLKNDPAIKSLLLMRLDEKAPLQHQKFILKLSNSSGLKESEAIKIDAVLKGLKCAGNTTVVSEVQNESRRYLEYEIDF